MYAQLGTIRFEGLKGFSSLEETFGVNYAQHERINGKPRLQAVGDNLNTISFGMYLHASFTDPEADIETMRLAMQNREILPLILGNGRVVGNFVIPNFTKSTGFTDREGNIIEATLSVELTECINDDPLLNEKRAAQDSAFATRERNSNIRAINPAKLSRGMVVTSSVAEIKTSGTLVNQYVAAAEQNPATFEYYSDQISESLDSIEENIQTVNSQLEAAQDLLDLAQSLPDALAAVNTRVQNMRSVLPISDITTFMGFNSSLQASIAGATAANVGLSNQSIIRRI
jgi:phage protein U